MTNSAATSTVELRCPDWRSHALWPGAAFLGLVAIFESTSIDLAIAERFYDPESGRWTWGASTWANAVIHEGGRDLVVLVGVAALATIVVSCCLPRARSLRRSAVFIVLTIGLATGTVALAKATTNVDCPWDLEPFGGARPYVHLLADRPDDLPPGRCFPGGHSSGGFSFLGLYFLLRERGRQLALGGLGLGLVIGSTFAVGQWVRGAHFASHDVWSGFICWFVALGLYVFAFGCRLTTPRATAAPVAATPDS